MLGSHISRWLIRCEYISFQRLDATIAVLPRWFFVIHLWGSLSQGAPPARVVKTTLHAVAPFRQVTPSSAVLPVPRHQQYFRLGFLEPTLEDQTEESLPIGGSGKTPFPFSMYGGSTLHRGAGGGRRHFAHGGRGYFHRVFEHHISPLHGQCAVLAKGLKDTPQDVPLNFSC